MSPLKKTAAAVQQLDKFRRLDRDTEANDGAASSETPAADTARVLEAIATCQTILTTKIEEVKTDVLLIRQDMAKLRDRVTETETRISRAEDVSHPLQHTADSMQRQHRSKATWKIWHSAVICVLSGCLKVRRAQMLPHFWRNY